MADSVVVATSAWNLAGDWERRPDYRKSRVIGGVAGGRGQVVGPGIVEAYRTSAALRMRRFSEWYKNHGDYQQQVGASTNNLPGFNIDWGVVLDHLPLEPYTSIDTVLRAHVGKAEPIYWVNWYMDKYYPGRSCSWVFSPSAGVITLEVSGVGTVTFRPSDRGYVAGSHYLYVEYMTTGYEINWSIYRRGSGIPELDAQIASVNPVVMGQFYPLVPFKYDNVPVVEGNGVYPLAKKAFKIGFGADFDDVQERVLDEEENPNIGEIDFIYAVFAASLNTKDRSSRKYIFLFFQYLLDNTGSPGLAEQRKFVLDWFTGKTPTAPRKSIEWSSMRSGLGNLRTQIAWSFMYGESGSGMFDAYSESGMVRFEVEPDPVGGYPADRNDGVNQQVRLTYQVNDYFWKSILITGLQYNCYVRVAEKSMTTAKVALLTDSRESEFLVPMHEVLFEELEVLDKIQVSNNCMFLVFNCYIEDREEWYESDWFKVIVVVVILAASIVAAIFTGGGSLGAGGAAVAGILGGTGLSAVAVLIIAASVDVLAGILISVLLTEVATALFGEEWGPIIGAILSFVFSFGMSAGSIAEVVNSLSKPDVWISLAAATGGAVASHMQYQADKMAEDTAKMMEEYGQKNAEVQRAYQEMVSGSTTGVDLSLVNRYIQETTERPSDFFKRTLATGHDVVEITLKQIQDFTRYNLQLVLP